MKNIQSMGSRWIVVLVLVGAWAGRPTTAQIVWQNMAGGNYTNPANWVGGVVPGAADTARFLSNETYTVTFTSSITNGVARFSAGSGTTTFDLNANEWLLSGPLFYQVNFDGTGGTVIFTNGLVSAAGHLGMGTTAGAHSNTLFVTSGGTARTIGFDIRIGEVASHNALIVTNGGEVVSQRFVYIGGSGTASNNVVTVSGAGSSLRAGAAATSVGVEVGLSGHGNRLVIENGGVVSNGQGRVGAAGTGHSALIVGGGVWTNTGNFTIGSAGRDHSVTVSNNGVLHVGGQISLGNGGSFNTLTVGPAGTVVANSHYQIGNAVGSSNNTMVVSGPGAEARTVLFDFNVGVTSSGNALIVTNGGEVVSQRFVYIGGSGTASNNVVTVTGPGSELRAGVAATSIGVEVGFSGHGNRLVIENGGVVSNGQGRVGAAGTGHSALITSGGVWTNTSNFTIGSAGRDHSVTVSNNGALIVGGQISLGNGGSFNTLTVGPGGTALAGSHIYLGTTVGSSNNTMVVSGPGAEARTIIYDVNVGFAANSNLLHVLDGGLVRAARFVYVGGGVGTGVGSTNNLLVVSGANSRVFADNHLFVGDLASSLAHRLVVENGGQVTNVTGYVGFAGRGHSALISGGTWSNTALIVGEGGRDHSVTVNNSGLLYGLDVKVGNGGTSNNLAVGPGGTVVSFGHLNVGYTAASSNNTMVVSGPGAVARTLHYDINVGNAGSYNRLVISNGGQVIAGRFTIVGTATAASNSLFVGPGGLLEVQATSGHRLQVGTGAGNTISNVSGIYQFLSASPTIDNGGSPTRISITDGTVSFRGIDNADVRVSSAGFALSSANMSWAGANTFMLNAASNTTSGQTYTFEAGNPTNFAHLALVNGQTAYRGGDITVGSTGSMWLSNTVADVLGVVTDRGLIEVKDSQVTFHSAVVVSGSYVSDPSTNTFLTTLTVTESGAMEGGVGDLFDFKENFFIHSTNRLGFALHQSGVRFSGGGMHTNAITGRDGGGGVAAWDAAFTLGTNFAYGELRLGSAADRVCFRCGVIPAVPTNALYVGWLDLLGDVNLVTNLHAPAGITVYYDVTDVRNGYLGGGNYQLTDCDLNTLGGWLMPVIPEPSVAALLALAACALWRRDEAKR